MYKHDCVECLTQNGLKCIWSVGFFDRFMGNDKVVYCPEYIRRMDLKK